MIRACALDDGCMDGIGWLKKTRRATIETTGQFVYNLRSDVLEEFCRRLASIIIAAAGPSKFLTEKQTNM